MPLFSLRLATPLPLEFARTDPTISFAYDTCLRAQQHVDANPASFPQGTLINIRILGYLLTHLSNTDTTFSRLPEELRYAQLSDRVEESPCIKPDLKSDPFGDEEARVLLLEDSRRALSSRRCGNETIISSQPSSTVDTVGDNSVDITALNELGQFYRDFFLRPFRKIKGRTAVTDSHPSRPSLELTQEEVRTMLAETPKDYSQSRTLAMRREGHRCIVSRSMDLGYYTACRPDPHSFDSRVAHLELCHIFSESTKAGLENAVKRKYATDAWDVLKSLGYIGIVQDIATEQKVHSLENVMMMECGLHAFFDSLALWFEPVEGTSDRYRVVQAFLFSFDLPDEVEFQCHDPLVSLPLPNPEYLRIHAAVCRISWLSGASAFFDELQEDMHENPDAATEMPAFAKSLHARLEHVSIVQV